MLYEVITRVAARADHAQAHLAAGGLAAELEDEALVARVRRNVAAARRNVGGVRALGLHHVVLELRALADRDVGDRVDGVGARRRSGIALDQGPCFETRYSVTHHDSWEGGA